MSEKNHEGKRTARERLREQRRREEVADKRNRVLKVAGAMIAVLAIAGVAGVLVANQGDGSGGGGGDTPPAAPITQGKGKAPATLTIYEDFRCPACGHFEETFRDTIHALEEAGQLKTEYHIVTIIDGNMGGKGSTNAANAAACARDQGEFGPYHDALFTNQPSEQDDAFADPKRLIELAGKVKGLDNKAFRTCVRGNEHAKWVERSNNAFQDSGHDSTPTVLLDGKDIYADPDNQLTPEKLRKMVAERA
ncbi:DsbA family protein [Streptomyces sp. N2-109]|uniref:DsbA family protein n=1 Tax=Streptomyces gossypii TaxID=2883101 RepID=A0ABT2K4G8_9ACTN|nr:DsbA family protein [Streptomyces gossypii]MCT2594369.1 DsbA family protein [Streptomyces gossypii]